MFLAAVYIPPHPTTAQITNLVVEEYLKFIFPGAQISFVISVTHHIKCPSTSRERACTCVQGHSCVIDELDTASASGPLLPGYRAGIP